MERETGLEPATSTLARWHSTIESLTHHLVQMKTDELLHPKALDPKSSASANSATPAFGGSPGNRTRDTMIKSHVLYRLS